MKLYPVVWGGSKIPFWWRLRPTVLDLEKIQHVVCAGFDGKKADLPEMGFLGKQFFKKE